MRCTPRSSGTASRAARDTFTHAYKLDSPHRPRRHRGLCSQLAGALVSWLARSGRVAARFTAPIRHEIGGMQGFMQLLMKPRNGVPWTADDRRALRGYFKRLARSLPALAIFALPGGMLLLPAFAYVLDRRRRRRGGLDVEVIPEESTGP